jgi:Per os infectivity factor AC110
MIVCIVLIIIIFVVCLVILLTLRLNKFQLTQLVYFQYNYIPESLLDTVKVISLKEDNDLFV